MADVRALLRQQRAARRITHPLATYSDAGKLLCTLCRDQIRAEAHWDAHLLSDKHKKLLAATTSEKNDANGEEYDQDEAEVEAEASEEDPRAADDAMSTTSQKRKLDDALGTDDEDLDMDHDEDEARRKRSRPEAQSEKAATSASENLSRKKSTMPSQGVEVQIASRSSTPIHHRELSSSSSVHSQPTNGPAGAAIKTTTITTSLPSRQASNLATPASSSSVMSFQYTNPQPGTTATTTMTTTAQPEAQAQTQQQVDEDEWAAFEADIAATTAAEPSYDDAVISRPAMTAEESAAAKEAAEADAEAAQNPETRKTKADADIEDEREEASRALEDEFEEMQELEARVQRLKEKREALLRHRRESLVEPVNIAGMEITEEQEAATKSAAAGAENGEAKENVKAAEDVDDTEAEDDEDDEDDWDGFRFRTGR